MLKQAEIAGAAIASRPQYRLAVITSHPVQYQAPLLQLLAQHPAIDLTVYYGNDKSLVGARDPGFGVAVSWDRPLLDGYKSSFLTRSVSKLTKAQTYKAYAAIIAELGREKYDAVFIHSYATPLSALAYLGAWLSRTPVLLRTESQMLTPRKWYVKAAKKMVLSPLFKATAGFLSIGKANRQFYANYGVPVKKMFHTPYSVDNNFFKQQAGQFHDKRAMLKQELGFEADLPIIMFSGKLQELKRLTDLIQAYQQLTERGVRAGLLMVGEGEKRAELEAFASQHELKYFHITGFKNQTELSAYYTCGDIVVLASRTEPWGLVVNEAMLFGMPAIISDRIGCGLDLVIPDVTGYVYPMGDIDRLAELLEALLQDPEKRAKMGAAARQHIADFSYEVCITGILDALQTVVPARKV